MGSLPSTEGRDPASIVDSPKEQIQLSMDAQMGKQDQILAAAGKTVLHDFSTNLLEVSRKPGHTPVSLTDLHFLAALPPPPPPATEYQFPARVSLTVTSAHKPTKKN